MSRPKLEILNNSATYMNIHQRALWWFTVHIIDACLVLYENEEKSISLIALTHFIWHLVWRWSQGSLTSKHIKIL